MSNPLRRLAAALAALAAASLAAGCASSKSTSTSAGTSGHAPPKMAMASRVGNGRGRS